MNQEAKALAQRYRREPKPGAPSTTYTEGQMARVRSRYRRRQRTVQTVLSDGAHVLDRHPDLVEELLADRVFTEAELDELVDVARRSHSDEGMRRHRSQAQADLNGMIRRVTKEWDAREAAERKAASEAEARKRLGYPKTALPDLEEVE